MTKQTTGKTVRETASMIRVREIVAEIHPRHLALRLKGSRGEPLLIGWGELYDRLEMRAAKARAGDIPPRRGRR